MRNKIIIVTFLTILPFLLLAKGFPSKEIENCGSGSDSKAADDGFPSKESEDCGTGSDSKAADDGFPSKESENCGTGSDSKAADDDTLTKDSNDKEQVDQKKDEKDSEFFPRVSGGHETTISDFPYAANYGFACGAVILSKYWLITAAQCSEQHQNIYAGSTSLARAKTISIAKHITHPKFHDQSNKFEFDYDYQLLKLKDPLEFTKYIQPIKLGSEKDMEPGTLATVVGWGASFPNGPGVDMLQAVSLPILNQDDCKTKANGTYAEYLSDNMLCAGHENGGEDACDGDSGGPLVSNGVLIGIVSFGKGCAEPDAPGVYAKISPEIKKWITKQIGSKNR